MSEKISIDFDAIFPEEVVRDLMAAYELSMVNFDVFGTSIIHLIPKEDGGVRFTVMGPKDVFVRGGVKS